MRHSDDALLTLIWEYMETQTPLAPADAIIVGSNTDTGTAAYAAELYGLGFAPVIVFSGDKQPGMDQTQADLLARTARDCGVPESGIMREQTARNGGETIRNAQALLSESQEAPKRVILIDRPYSLRSLLATAEAQWAGSRPAFIARHEAMGLPEYSLRHGRGETIRGLLGSFQRLRSYAKKGYQSPQVIPDNVQDAYDTLIQRGHHTQ
jgi:uncharacterized SAM-binding protein YcdF (DUF218 family)